MQCKRVERKASHGLQSNPIQQLPRNQDITRLNHPVQRFKLPPQAGTLSDCFWWLRDLHACTQSAGDNDILRDYDFRNICPFTLSLTSRLVVCSRGVSSIQPLQPFADQLRPRFGDRTNTTPRAHPINANSSYYDHVTRPPYAARVQRLQLFVLLHIT